MAIVAAYDAVIEVDVATIDAIDTAGDLWFCGIDIAVVVNADAVVERAFDVADIYWVRNGCTAGVDTVSAAIDFTVCDIYGDVAISGVDT